MRLWKLNVKSFFGSVKSNLKKRCKMLLTQPSDRQKLLPWEKRFTECSFNMNSSVRNRRSSLRIWRDLFSREKLSNSNIYQKLKRRTHRIDHHKVNCPGKSLTWSKHWDTPQKTPCSLILLSSREGEEYHLAITKTFLYFLNFSGETNKSLECWHAEEIWNNNQSYKH